MLRPALLAAIVVLQCGVHAAVLAPFDRAIERAVAEHRIPGGVLHYERKGAVYEKAYGNRALEPETEPATRDTIYDMASITKVTATAPSIWLLIQRGKLALDDRASKYLPEFRGGWRDEVTIRHLLTHTSGLRPDLDLDKPWEGYETGIQLALAEEPRNRPGFTFRYSDINYELLGEIVRRVSGVPLDEFARREIFVPLGMLDTGFRGRGVARSRGASGRIAPTEQLRGVVHDPTSRRMGGVAGHAGLFSTARDMARFARMLLRGGSPIFTPEIVKMMTSVQSPANVSVKRAGGFDLDSSFSRPRGDLYPIGSYGHTGFTGTMLWIDPASKSFYIFLSNRVHPDGKGSVLALQRELGTLAARAAGYRKPVPRRIDWVTGGADVANGIDVLHGHAYDVLRGSRVGLITNHTGIDRSWNPTIDLLRSAPGVELRALFSPEHGIRGTEDAKVGDTRDAASGLPVHSLYGETRKPSPEQLRDLDTLVFDIQDAGARFYTYVATMALAMEAAAEAKVRFVVLDRVNPIGGEVVGGPLLQGETSFTAPHPIVIQHGMTVGELARMIRDEKHLDLDLVVVPLRGWKRAQWQDDAGLPWINPSPNLRSLTAAGLYPGVAQIEYAISVGRGTDAPFEVAGAPWIDGPALARALDALAIPGIRFEATRFTPSSSLFAKQECGGVRMTITDRKSLRATDVGLALIHTIHRLYPNELDLDKVNVLVRDPRTMAMLRDGKSLAEITAMWRADETAFAARRAKYLLYPPDGGAPVASLWQPARTWTSWSTPGPLCRTPSSPTRGTKASSGTARTTSFAERRAGCMAWRRACRRAGSSRTSGAS